MKFLFRILAVLSFGFLVISCSSESTNSDEKSDKRLVQIIYDYSEIDVQLVRNIKYDSEERIYLINDNQGKTIESYQYNSNGKLFKKEFNDYNSESNVLQNKEVTEFDFNSENKISGVTETYSYYDTDGNFTSESSVFSEVTYSDNKMIRLNTSHDYKTEYGFNNDNLITSIKVYRSDVLKSDMLFEYDATGNCVSGSGLIAEGSLDNTTDNINLNVDYEDFEKDPVFNQFFEYDILSTGQSFSNLKQILVMQQGNRYAKEISWYTYQNSTNKETYEYRFDASGYPINVVLSDLPNYPNYGSITYTWE